MLHFIGDNVYSTTVTDKRLSKQHTGNFGDEYQMLLASINTEDTL
jgi:hypothetical protein